jgi:hypothetical protein
MFVLYPLRIFLSASERQLVLLPMHKMEVDTLAVVVLVLVLVVYKQEYLVVVEVVQA